MHQEGLGWGQLDRELGNQPVGTKASTATGYGPWAPDRVTATPRLSTGHAACWNMKYSDQRLKIERNNPVGCLG